MKQSIFGKINWRDILKGFITAFITAALTMVMQLLDSGHLPDISHLKAAGAIGLIAGLSYVVKNLLTNSDDQFLKPEAPKAPSENTPTQS